MITQTSLVDLAKEALADAKVGTPGPWEYHVGEMYIVPSPSKMNVPDGREGWCGEASNGQDGRIMARMRGREPFIAAALISVLENNDELRAHIEQLQLFKELAEKAEPRIFSRYHEYGDPGDLEWLDMLKEARAD